MARHLLFIKCCAVVDCRGELSSSELQVGDVFLINCIRELLSLSQALKNESLIKLFIVIMHEKGGKTEQKESE
jgi:hypothetical protein